MRLCSHNLLYISIPIVVVDYPESGCSMKFLLEWAWTKVTEVKVATDDWCGQLSAGRVGVEDIAMIRQLHHYQTITQVVSSLLQTALDYLPLGTGMLYYW
jgi:hypothetical protein